MMRTQILVLVSLKKVILEQKIKAFYIAVCIEEYKVGETVRILPCNHRFHKACIDQWLLDKRTCPMCKMDILKYYGLIGDSEMMNFEEREESLLNLT